MSWLGEFPMERSVQKEYLFNALDNKELSLSLTSPDFSSAVSMANAINQEFKSGATNIAKAVDPATVTLNFDRYSS